jgi:predicted outer membrane repeat protein
VTFTGCTSGAVLVSGGSLTVQDSTFTANQAMSGNGGALSCTSTAGSLDISNTVFASNTATKFGGAVFAQDCTVTMSTSQFTNNTASLSGGGLYMQRGQVRVTSGTTFIGNVAQRGGAVCLSETVATLTDANIRLNTASLLGAGVYLEFSQLAVATSNLTGNTIPGCSTCAGAGMYCTGQKTFTVSTTSFTANTVGGTGGCGGGLALSACAIVTDSTTFVDNSAESGGGVAVMAQSTASFQRCTWLRNAASMKGGGLYVDGSQPVVVDNSTFTANNASQFGGAVYVSALSSVTATSAPAASNVYAHNWAGNGGGAVFWLCATEPSIIPGASFQQNRAAYGASWATPASSLQWSLTLPNQTINTLELIMTPGTSSLQLLLEDNYKQVVAYDSSSSVTLSFGGPIDVAATNVSAVQVAGRGAMPLPLTSNALRTSAQGGWLADSGSVLYAVSAVAQMGVFRFGSDASTAFAVQVQPGLSMPLKGVAQLSGSVQMLRVLTSVAIIVPTRYCVPGEYGLECAKCNPGKYSNVSRAIACENCPAGSFTALTSQTACEVCPPGYQCSNGNPGATTKVVCPEGQYTYNNSKTPGACVLCPANSFSPPTGERTQCLCTGGPPGKGFYMKRLTPADGASFVDSTQPEKLACVLCPEGADCSQPGTTIENVKALPGWWPDITRTNSKFIKCLNSACIGGAKVCAPYYFGNLCTRCEKGLTRDDSTFECNFCPDPTMNKVRIVLVIITAVAVMSGVIFFTVRFCCVTLSCTISVYLVCILLLVGLFVSLLLYLSILSVSFCWLVGLLVSLMLDLSAGRSFFSLVCLFCMFTGRSVGLSFHRSMVL